MLEWEIRRKIYFYLRYKKPPKKVKLTNLKRSQSFNRI